MQKATEECTPQKEPSPARAKLIAEEDEVSIDDDQEWEPQVSNFVWTRFDRSRTQALGLIVGIPNKPECRKLDKGGPSVYCDLFNPDERYNIAIINSEAHVYPPRHYLQPFSSIKADNLKCMKSKTASLTPWDKTKRRAIRDVLAFRDGAIEITDAHNVNTCTNCLDEGPPEFWQAIGVEKGEMTAEMKVELEKHRKMVKRQAAERDKRAQAREEQLAQRKARKPSQPKESPPKKRRVSRNDSDETSEKGDNTSTSSNDEEEEASSGEADPDYEDRAKESDVESGRSRQKGKDEKKNST